MTNFNAWEIFLTIDFFASVDALDFSRDGNLLAKGTCRDLLAEDVFASAELCSRLILFALFE